MLIRAITSNEKRKILTRLFAPFLILALYLDIKNGQYFPVYTNLNPIISLLVFVVMEYVLVEYVKAIVPNIIGNEVFIVCPRCHFNNSNPISICNNCRYSNNQSVDYDCLHQNNNGLGKSGNMAASQFDCTKLSNSISNRKKTALNLRQNEVILANIKISPFRGVYKNGSKLFIDSLIITQFRVILIKYCSITGGWRTREDLSALDIMSVKVQIKWHYAKEVNLLVYQLNNGDVYELFYSAFDNSAAVLEDISDCIKSTNSNLTIKAES